MAKKPQSDNYDALGSVFDFIFKEAEKPPDRRRPIRPTGVSGTTELTEAVFAALEKPGAFMSNTVVDELNGALELELGRVTFDDFGNVKVTTNNIVDLIKDPQGTVEKALKTGKAIRKSKRAMFLGAVAEDFVISGWAHKYGDLEAKLAVRGLTSAKEIEAEKNTIKRAMGQFSATHTGDGASIYQGTRIPGRFGATDKDFMANRAADLLGRRVFGEGRWNNTLSEAERSEFVKRISGGYVKDREKGGHTEKDIYDYLVDEYGSTAPEAANFRKVTGYDPSAGKADVVDVFNPKLYLKLEKANIAKRIGEIKRADPSSASTALQDEKKMYERTLLLLNRNKVELRNQIDNIKRDFRSTTDPNRKKELRDQLKHAKGALRELDGHTLLGQVGKWEGYIGSLNNIWGGALGTSVVPSVLNGTFYDAKRNTLFNPTQESELKLGKSTIEYYTAKDTRDSAKPLPGQKLVSKYNQMAIDLYYVTPRSLFRTLLYNGEAFAYMMDRQVNGIVKKLDKEGFNISTIVGADKLSNAPGAILGAFGKLEGKDLDDFIDDVVAQARSGGLDEKLVKKLEGVLKTSKGLKQALSRHSGVFRVQQRIQTALNKRLIKARSKIAEFILKNPTVRKLFAKNAAGKLLGQWISQGGINVFLKSITTAAVSALGLTMTPIVSIVVGAITWVATDLAMKAFGVMVNIFKWAAIGAIGILIIVLSMGIGNFRKFNKQNYLYTHEIPGSIGGCFAYEEIELDDWEDGGWDENVVIPPPSGEECIFGEGSFACTQGYIDVAGWSHQNTQSVMPVDLAYVSYIHAPQFCDTGNCSITRIAKINCSDGKDAGGIVEFDANDGNTTYHFKLLHVQPLAGQGEKLRGGQAVAVVQDGFEKGRCWTGKHLHIETTQNGGVVDPLELLQSFSCSVPDESGCPDAP